MSCARSLSDTTHFHVDLEGRYIPGLCAGLAFGVEELGSPLPAGKYLLLERLAATGIQGLYDLAREVHGYQTSRETYLSHCDLCTDIRRHLVQRNNTDFPELSPEEFYE